MSLFLPLPSSHEEQIKGGFVPHISLPEPSEVQANSAAALLGFQHSLSDALANQQGVHSHALARNRVAGLNAKAISELKKGNVVSAEACLREARREIRQHKLSDELRALTYKNFGCLWKRCTRFEDALVCFERASEYESRGGQPIRQASSVLLCATCFMQLQRFQDVITASKQALKLVGPVSSNAVPKTRGQAEAARVAALARFHQGVAEQRLGNAAGRVEAALGLVIAERLLGREGPLFRRMFKAVRADGTLRTAASARGIDHSVADDGDDVDTIAAGFPSQRSSVKSDGALNMNQAIPFGGTLHPVLPVNSVRDPTTVPLDYSPVEGLGSNIQLPRRAGIHHDAWETEAAVLPWNRAQADRSVQGLMQDVYKMAEDCNSRAQAQASKKPVGSPPGGQGKGRYGRWVQGKQQQTAVDIDMDHNSPSQLTHSPKAPSAVLLPEPDCDNPRDTQLDGDALVVEDWNAIVDACSAHSPAKIQPAYQQHISRTDIMREDPPAEQQWKQIPDHGDLPRTQIPGPELHDLKSSPLQTQSDFRKHYFTSGNEYQSDLDIESKPVDEATAHDVAKAIARIMEAKTGHFDEAKIRSLPPTSFNAREIFRNDTDEGSKPPALGSSHEQETDEPSADESSAVIQHIENSLVKPMSIEENAVVAVAEVVHEPSLDETHQMCSQETEIQSSLITQQDQGLNDDSASGTTSRPIHPPSPNTKIRSPKSESDPDYSGSSITSQSVLPVVFSEVANSSQNDCGAGQTLQVTSKTEKLLRDELEALAIRAEVQSRVYEAVEMGKASPRVIGLLGLEEASVVSFSESTEKQDVHEQVSKQATEDDGLSQQLVAAEFLFAVLRRRCILCRRHSVTRLVAAVRARSAREGFQTQLSAIKVLQSHVRLAGPSKSLRLISTIRTYLPAREAFNNFFHLQTSSRLLSALCSSRLFSTVRLKQLRSSAIILQACLRQRQCMEVYCSSRAAAKLLTVKSLAVVCRHRYDFVARAGYTLISVCKRRPLLEFHHAIVHAICRLQSMARMNRNYSSFLLQRFARNQIAWRARMIRVRRVYLSMLEDQRLRARYRDAQQFQHALCSQAYANTNASLNHAASAIEERINGHAGIYGSSWHEKQRELEELGHKTNLQKIRQSGGKIGLVEVRLLEDSCMGGMDDMAIRMQEVAEDQAAATISLAYKGHQAKRLVAGLALLRKRVHAATMIQQFWLRSSKDVRDFRGAIRFFDMEAERHHLHCLMESEKEHEGHTGGILGTHSNSPCVDGRTSMTLDADAAYFQEQLMAAGQYNRTTSDAS